MNLRQETIEFLKSGNQFNFEFNSSDVGPITLKSFDDLEGAVVSLESDSPDDDIRELDPFVGCYKIPVVDLVQESERYYPEGILAWFPHYQKFGTYDNDHSSVMLWDCSWEDIVDDPQKYFDDQWTYAPIGKRPLLWLDYDFQIDDIDYTFKAYPKRCQLHVTEIKERTTDRSSKNHLIKMSNTKQYLEDRLELFTYSGSPIEKSKPLACSVCADAKKKWFKETVKNEKAVETTATPNGWITCPYCEIKFKATDTRAFKGARHHCAKKIRVVNG